MKRRLPGETWRERQLRAVVDRASVGITVVGPDGRVIDANAAFGAWGARTGYERGELLHRVADACERRRDDLARTLTLDQGKPLKAEAE